jgi:hypothetical protein
MMRRTSAIRLQNLSAAIKLITLNHEAKEFYSIFHRGTNGFLLTGIAQISSD